MKNTARNLYLATAQMDASKVRLVMFLLTLAMFVVAAGAPDAGGDFVR
jgi:hypothetical protein